MASSCVRRGWDWILGKNVFTESGQALAQAAQGGGGVPIPGGVQKMCRCGTLGYGLAGMGGLGGWLDVMILEVFSNLTYDILAWFAGTGTEELSLLMTKSATLYSYTLLLALSPPR